MRSRSLNVFVPALITFALMLCYEVTLIESGPHLCSDRLKNYFATHLTEFPTNPDDNTNFLDYGDACNVNAQSMFEKQLLRTFNSYAEDQAKSNEEIIRKLDLIWDQFRGHTVDGALGDRVCNPRRLLSCHPTLKQCVCRPDFHLDDPHAKDSYKGITVHSETITTVNAAKDRTETAIACRAINNCQWKAPWLGFCHILCVKDHYCIGVDTLSSGGADANERCVRCEPYTTEGLERCTEEGASLSMDKKERTIHVHFHSGAPYHRQIPGILLTAILLLIISDLNFKIIKGD